MSFQRIGLQGSSSARKEPLYAYLHEGPQGRQILEVLRNLVEDQAQAPRGNEEAREPGRDEEVQEGQKEGQNVKQQGGLLVEP